MKWIIFAAVVFVEAHAHAALIGAQMLVAHRYESRIDASSIIIVEDGIGDLVDLYLGMNSDGRVGYMVDVNSNSLLIDFYLPRSYTLFNPASGINGLYLSSLELDARSFIDSAEITQENFFFSSNRFVFFDEHTVGLDFQNLEFNDFSSLQIRFLQPRSVPEPATVLLFGTGIIVLYGCRRWMPVIGL